MDKAQLRKNMKDTLASFSDQDRTERSKAGCQRLISTRQFHDASVIMVYLSLPHEFDITSVILHAWQQEKIVVVPKVSWQQRHIIPVEINSLEVGISVDKHGLRNPVTGLPMPIEEIDLVVVPGLAFDTAGHRLGRGGGYYDRFLSTENIRATKCGFVFSDQVIKDLPAELHDQKVNMIVTDKSVMECKS